LIDLACVGLYFFQSSFGSTAIYMIGFILQLSATLFLVVASLTYKGKKYTRWSFTLYNTTFRYDIIVISAIVNALIAFLYGLNVFGINNVIFPH
jgi:hypothetical protein